MNYFNKVKEKETIYKDDGVLKDIEIDFKDGKKIKINEFNEFGKTRYVYFFDDNENVIKFFDCPNGVKVTEFINEFSDNKIIKSTEILNDITKIYLFDKDNKRNFELTNYILSFGLRKMETHKFVD